MCIRDRTANGSPAVHIKDATRELKIGTSGYILDNESGDLVFRSNSDAERLRIKDNGTATGQFVARAWINFNGTGTIATRDSHNVSSIADNGTGDYTVTFSTAMSNANYSVGASGTEMNYGTVVSQKSVATMTTSSVQLWTFNNAASPAFGDPASVSCQIFGD